MSKFSIKLRELIATKNVDKLKLASSLNIDRALLYRYLNDASFPQSDEFVSKVSAELCLTPYESKELHTSYEITKLGEEVCEQRKIVSDMINKIYFKNTAWQNTVFLDNKGKSLVNEPITTFFGVENVFTALKNIIDDDKTTFLKLSLQPDNSFVVNSLIPIMQNRAENKKITIQHLMRFQSKTNDNPSLYNLKIFGNVLPILYHCNYHTESEYIAHYYYNNHASASESAMELFSNTIITPWCVCLLKHDYSDAIVLNSENVCEQYIKHFKFIHDLSTPFAIDAKKQRFWEWKEDNLQQTEFREFVFKAHPSVHLGFPKNYFETLKKDADEELLNRRLTYNRTLHSQTHVARHDFFTTYGLQNLITTGKFSTSYANALTNYSKLSLKDFLHNYIGNMEKYDYFFTHIIKSDLPGCETSDFSLYIVGDDVIYLESPHREEKSRFVIQVTESSIVEAFSEYLNSGIWSEDRVISNEETLEYLKDVYNNLFEKEEV